MKEIILALIISCSIGFVIVPHLQQPSQTHTINIPTEIKEGSFDADIRILQKLKKNDKVVVIMNTCGGNVISGLNLISALKRTEADVVIKIDYLALSMGFVIATSGLPIEISDDALLMTHMCVNPNGETITGNPLADYFNGISDNNPEIRSILTQKEWELYSQGKEIFIKGYDFKARIRHINLELAQKLLN